MALALSFAGIAFMVAALLGYTETVPGLNWAADYIPLTTILVISGVAALITSGRIKKKK